MVYLALNIYFIYVSNYLNNQRRRNSNNVVLVVVMNSICEFEVESSSCEQRNAFLKKFHITQTSVYNVYCSIISFSFVLQFHTNSLQKNPLK